MHYYKLNNEGGYGLPELWACEECMRTAEPGSRMQRMRDSLYHEWFPEFPEEMGGY